jgi:hypothetical protein
MYVFEDRLWYVMLIYYFAVLYVLEWFADCW